MKRQLCNTTIRQKGAVSLFIVVFTTLLVTVVTVSFIRIMVQDQQQATDSDLSQSAYDSALAGVEDAKRSLAQYQSRCMGEIAVDDTVYCNAAKLQLEDATACNAGLAPLGIDPTADEVVVQRSASESNQLDQAYTCVKINPYTDYYGVALQGESKVIPVRSNTPVNTIKIEWYTRDDMPSGQTSPTLVNPTTSQKLYSMTDWTQRRPSLMRAQFIDYGTSGGQFTLGDIDANGTSSLFLYPTATGSTLFAFPAVRKENTSSTQLLQLTTCKSLATNTYSCAATIQLPRQVAAGSTALLRLTALYNKTNYKVSLFSDASAMVSAKFSWVQPEVDSTGRANDLFRRVQSHIDMDASFPYPEAALETGEKLCKDFTVTDTTDEDGGYSIRCEP